MFKRQQTRSGIFAAANAAAKDSAAPAFAEDSRSADGELQELKFAQVGVVFGADSMSRHQRRTAQAGNMDPSVLQSLNKNKKKRRGGRSRKSAAAMRESSAAAAEPSMLASDHLGESSSSSDNQPWDTYIPLVPHPQLATAPLEVIPAGVLLAHSPFAHLTKDKAMLGRLADAFTTVRFARGDLLPDSPFYLVARGSVTCRVIADGRPVATKCARRARGMHTHTHTHTHICRA